MDAKNWKIGLSSCCRGAVDRAVFEEYAANGIGEMELTLPYDKFVLLDWEQVGRDARETGVHIHSLHLPFYPFALLDLSSPDAALRGNTVQVHKTALTHAAALGIKIAVVHASGEPNPPEERAARLQYAGESLAALADFAAPYGITIAVEDLPRTCIGNCSADIKALLQYDDRLRVCFDTNHLLGEKNADFVRAVGDKIVTLHVSDYDLRNERHWLPYEGKNDWVELVTLLENAGYAGPFMYEIPCNAPHSIARRPITFADFYENYTACVTKQLFETFGVPDEAVCVADAYVQPAGKN